MKTPKAYLASRNPNKLKEAASVFEAEGIEILPIPPGIPFAPIEGEASYVENARIKSLELSRVLEGISIGEDSGLEVFCLDGFPGLRSSRIGSSDDERIEILLGKLKGIPEEMRGARYVASAVLSQGDRVIFECEEYAEGIIAQERRGYGGFGYDPIFIYPPLNRHMAELSLAEKNRISHRGKALARVVEFLKDKYEI